MNNKDAHSAQYEMSSASVFCLAFPISVYIFSDELKMFIGNFLLPF
jgi:hypothetical protein